MKIAIPPMGEKVNSLISGTLRRAPFILIYNSTTEEIYSVENPDFKIQDGSGLKVVNIILQNAVDVLFTREIGRKAYSLLMKECMEIDLLKSSGTVKSAIKKYANK